MDVSGEYLFDAPRDMVWKALQDPNVLGSVMPGGQGFTQVAENEFTGVLMIKVGPVQGTFQGKIKLSNVVPPESYQMEVDGKGAPGFVKATGNIKLEARDSQTHLDYSGTAQVGGRIASVGQRLIETSAKSIIRQSLDGLNEYLKVQVAQQIAQQAAQAAQAAPPLPLTPAAPETPAASTAPATATPTPAAMSAAPVAPAASAERPAPTMPMSASSAMPATLTSSGAPIPTYKPPSQTSLMFNVAKDVLNDMIPKQYQPLVIGVVIIVILLLLVLIFRR